MHGVLSNLTATLLALHTVLGCCWHHAHRCEGTCDAPASVVAMPSSDHGLACCVNTSLDSPDHGNHGQRDCRGMPCVFVSVPKTPPQGLHLSVSVLPGAFVQDDLSFEDDAHGQFRFAPDSLLPPLRRHLICRVLLI